MNSQDWSECRRRSQARQQKAELHRLNKMALVLIREIKSTNELFFTPAICAALKSSVEQILNERRAVFKELARLKPTTGAN